jgi:hypothetical protein
MVVQRDSQAGRTTALLVWAAMALVLLDLVVYVMVIRGQGAWPPDAFTVPFVAGYMVIMALLLWLSLLDAPNLAALRPALRGGAAAGLLLLGVFALFSVGLPLFVAGVLTSITAIRALAGRGLRSAVLSEVAAAVIAVAVLVAGFAVTQRLIVCPPSGTMGGGGYALFTGTYSYECVNGTLTWHSGGCNGVSNGNPLPSNC